MSVILEQEVPVQGKAELAKAFASGRAAAELLASYKTRRISRRSCSISARSTCASGCLPTPIPRRRSKRQDRRGAGEGLLDYSTRTRSTLGQMLIAWQKDLASRLGFKSTAESRPTSTWRGERARSEGPADPLRHRQPLPRLPRPQGALELPQAGRDEFEKCLLLQRKNKELFARSPPSTSRSTSRCSKKIAEPFWFESLSTAASSRSIRRTPRPTTTSPFFTRSTGQPEGRAARGADREPSSSRTTRSCSTRSAGPTQERPDGQGESRRSSRRSR